MTDRAFRANTFQSEFGGQSGGDGYRTSHSYRRGVYPQARADWSFTGRHYTPAYTRRVKRLGGTRLPHFAS